MENLIVEDELKVQLMSEEGKPSVIWVVGELTTQNSKNFMDTAQGVISQMAMGESLVFNLEKLTYASSTGIGAFSNILLTCKKKSIHLTLLKVQQRVKEVFSVLGFTTFFNFED